MRVRALFSLSAFLITSDFCFPLIEFRTIQCSVCVTSNSLICSVVVDKKIGQEILQGPEFYRLLITDTGLKLTCRIWNLRSHCRQRSRLSLRKRPLEENRTSSLGVVMGAQAWTRCFSPARALIMPKTNFVWSIKHCWLINIPLSMVD